MKFGLWEDGKRIEWFDESQVQQINKKTLDYTQYFNTGGSAEMVEPNAVFSKPIGFEDKLNDIKKKIA